MGSWNLWIEQDDTVTCGGEVCKFSLFGSSLFNISFGQNLQTRVNNFLMFYASGFMF